jgi:hypothetical protein
MRLEIQYKQQTASTLYMLTEKFQGHMKFYTAAEGMIHSVSSCHIVGHEFQQYTAVCRCTNMAAYNTKDTVFQCTRLLTMDEIQEL